MRHVKAGPEALHPAEPLQALVNASYADHKAKLVAA